MTKQQIDNTELESSYSEFTQTQLKLNNLEEVVKQTSKLKLLYVEDDKQLQVNMMSLLDAFFKSITVASNGKEGLELYKNEQFDIVLTDVGMPILNGIEMAKEIKFINPTQPIIITTAHAESEYLLEAVKYGIDGYILKPFLFNQINETFSRVVQNILLKKEHDNYQQKLEKNIAKRTKELELSKQELEEQKNELEAIFNTSKDGIAIIDLETNFLDFNNSYLQMTGFTREELLAKSCTGLSDEKNFQKSKDVINIIMEQGHYENFEKTCIVKNDKKIVVNMSLALMPNKKQIIVSARDLTEERIAQRRIKDYTKLIDANVFTSTTNLKGNIIKVSQAFSQRCGYSEKELIGNKHKILRAPDTDIKIYEQMWNVLLSDKTWYGEIKNIKKNGEYFWMQLSISPIYNDENIKIGYTSIGHDITDKKCTEKLSITDELTGLFNRKYFDEMFPKIINSAKRKNDLICFLIFGIDYFRLYNDTYGHIKGNYLLTNVANSIKESLGRVDDYSFRLGAEEFCVIFKTESINDSTKFANNIRTDIEDLQIPHENSDVSKFVTVSMGLVCKRAKDIESEELLYSEADKLLHTAKKSGRNKVVVADD